MNSQEWARELADSEVLHDISTQLINENRTEDLYQKIVEAACTIMRSEFASLQMYCAERGVAGELQLLAFRGFTPEAAKFWEWVKIGSASVCGEALRLRARAVVADVQRCEFMAGSDDLDAYLQTGILSAQTTPLFSRSGRLVGMLSTHWQKPHTPSERELRYFDILARQAADLIEHRRAHDELETQIRERTAEIASAHESLRSLSMRLMQSQDEERRRVARELHDSAGQMTLAIGCALEDAERNAGDPAALSCSLGEARALLDQLGKEIRTTSYLLHPPLLDECGLVSAIRWYVDGLAKRGGIAIAMEAPENLGRMPADLETTLFRIVQESLTNIHRHSGSKTARIFIERHAESVALRIEDDGRGIPPEILASGAAPSSGVGLAGMRERVHHLNGKMKIDSGADGTKVLITFPAHANEPPQLEAASAD
jgi:signal transduction histidine kinase